jgi:hypothetical protein
MSLSVLKNGLGTMYHCTIKHELTWLAIFVQIVPFLTTNEIKYVLYDGIIF